MLGRIALAAKDLEAAGAHLVAAGATPGSPQLNSFGPDVALAPLLLAAGTPGPVLAYLTAIERFWSGRAPLLAHWRATIEGGEIPNFAFDRLFDYPTS